MNMREQTGLDALATLCGGVANSASSPDGMQALKNEIQRQQQHHNHQLQQHQQQQHQQLHQQQQQQQKHQTSNGAMHHHSSILNTQHPVAAAASNPNTALLETSNSSGAPSQNQQQLWYQAFMTAAAYGGLNPLLSQIGAGATGIPVSNIAAAATIPNHLQQQPSAAAISNHQQQQAVILNHLPQQPAAGAISNHIEQPSASAMSIHQQHPSGAGVDTNSFNAVQQLAFYTAYQAATAAAQTNSSTPLPNQANKFENDLTVSPQTAYADHNLAAMMIARAQQQQQQSFSQVNTVENNNMTVTIPATNSKVSSMLSTTVTVPSPSNKTVASNKMTPSFSEPQKITRDRSVISEKKSYNKVKVSPPIKAKRHVSQISLPEVSLNGSLSDSNNDASTAAADFDDFEEPQVKKVQKRAANRRSAQLSRKRKKQFIEELKEENDDLRRKEQILSSIPDLVVAFDLSGRILFISNSVESFLGYKPDELESSCFWDRICEDSIRLLKAAFMDALAAKKPGVDVTPLGDGLWEVQLVDKTGTPRLVSLNGVVHFSSDNPECVCSIRRPIPVSTKTNASSSIKYASRNSSKISYSSSDAFVKDAVKPQQSVLNTLSSDDSSSVLMLNNGRVKQSNIKANVIRPLQVNDGGFVSESNSDES